MIAKSVPQPEPAVRSRVRLDVVLLCVVVLTVGTVNFLWLTYDTTPLGWDLSVHMLSELRYHKLLSDFTDSASRYLSPRAWAVLYTNLVVVDSAVYPPLAPLVSALVALPFGNSVRTLSIATTVFLALLAFSLYRLSAAIHSRKTGVVAAMLVILYPIVFAMSRQPMIEVPLLAMTALSCYFLLSSQLLANRSFTALFGVSFGLGLLTKLTYATFLAGPLLYVLWLLLSEVRMRRLGFADALLRLRYLALWLVAGFLVAGLWYVPNFSSFIEHFSFVTTLNPRGLSRTDLGNYLYFPAVLARDQIGIPFLLLFLFGLFRLGKSLPVEPRRFVLIWLSSIYVIHTLSTHKNTYQDIGILLPVAIISAAGLTSLGTRWRLFASIAVLFGFVQVAAISLPESAASARLGRFEWAGNFPWYPKQEEWRIEEALRLLGQQPGMAAVLSDHIYINGSVFRHYGFRLDMPLGFRTCQSVTSAADVDLGSYDYVIAKSDADWIYDVPKGAACFAGAAGRSAYLSLVARLNPEDFATLGILPLPDHTSLMVFKNRSMPLSGQGTVGVEK